jgi:hypothetical protein
MTTGDSAGSRVSYERSRRAAVVARDRNQHRMRTLTAAAGLTGVLAAGAIAATLPGSAHASSTDQHASTSNSGSSSKSATTGSTSPANSSTPTGSSGLSPTSPPSSSSGSGQVSSGGS